MLLRIQFLRDETYESEGPNKGPKFVAGELIDGRVDFANRWLHRQVAILVGDGEDIGDELFVRRGEAPLPAPEPDPEKPAPAAEVDKPAAAPAKGGKGGKTLPDGTSAA